MEIKTNFAINEECVDIDCETCPQIKPCLEDVVSKPSYEMHYSLPYQNNENKFFFIAKDGVIWYPLKRVCKILEMDIKVAEKLLNPDKVKLVNMINYLSGKDKIRKAVNDAGLFELISKSKSQDALHFKKWILETREMVFMNLAEDSKSKSSILEFLLLLKNK